MPPKLWPNRLTYAKESVSAEVNITFLRHYLLTCTPEGAEKSSWMIKKKCVHPHLRIKKITDASHPLSGQKTLKGYANLGIFAAKQICKGEEIGEYVGEIFVTSTEEKDAFAKACRSEYSWVVKIHNFFLTIDAQNIANELALVNDYRGLRSSPNVKMRPIIHEGVLYFGYIAVCDIQKGEEVLADYGEIFWTVYNGAQTINK